QGQGQAVWTLRASPQNRVVWKGSFSSGVYLPSPGIVAAREWSGPGGDSDTVLFDMGALPAQNGIPAARLEVQAASDLTNYPDPCKPRALWVVNAPAVAMVNDTAAHAMLTAAADKLKAHCGAKLNEPDRPSHDRTHVQVRAVATPDLKADRWGNPGPVIAEAYVPLVAGGAIERYTNQAAQQQGEQQKQAQDQDQRQTNMRRLRAFFNTYQAQGWASLDDIAENPFRYSGRVVVTAAQVDAVVNPTRALLDSLPDDWGSSNVVLDGDGIGQWKPGPRLLAVRVLGRIQIKKSDCDADPFCGLAQLQLVGSQACTESRCTDWLHLPKPLKDGQTP
ncbi:MAG: hypothetical protein LBH31_09985, partial [Burkholderiaceae bacterium]|nr:hypothetical protein [Burkholderiaceae bacterium]